MLLVGMITVVSEYYRGEKLPVDQVRTVLKDNQ